MLQKTILEVLAEEEEKDFGKIRGGTMTGGTFVSAGTKQRKKVNPEVDAQEKQIINQMNEFFIKLAAIPGIELGQHRMVLQRILNLMKSQFQQEVKQAQN